MILLLILALTELLTFLAIRQHFKGFSRTRYYLSMITNAILSCFMWILYVEVKSYDGNPDDPGYVWLLMSLSGTFSAVLVPRIILVVMHFTGKIIRYRTRGHIRALTNTGFIIWIIAFILIISGTLKGRFNYKTEEITIEAADLHPDLEGLKIVQISDLHLSGFHRHKEFIAEVMNEIYLIKPDLLINTGDFVTVGPAEFQSYDTLLSLASGSLGSFAVIGNHDAGTYYKGLDAAGRDTAVKKVGDKIIASGYQLLNDGNFIIRKGTASVGIAGVITRGRHGRMIHGDLSKASAGLDSTNFNILLSHDPDHWRKSVTGKTDFDLTLSGHTHGMQLGIISRMFKWSPAKYIYKEWNGLYREGSQYLYVNRGLGVLAIPFRIGMPPEITVITLKKKQS